MGEGGWGLGVVDCEGIFFLVDGRWGGVGWDGRTKARRKEGDILFVYIFNVASLYGMNKACM